MCVFFWRGSLVELVDWNADNHSFESPSSNPSMFACDAPSMHPPAATLGRCYFALDLGSCFFCACSSRWHRQNISQLGRALSLLGAIFALWGFCGCTKP